MSRGEPKVTLTSHIDTVPDGPSVAVTPESIIGRGACDAKGQIVAQLWGLWQACQRGLANYRCAYVVGEEVDSVGARAFLDLPTTPYILNGEPTGNLFARRSWGVVDVELETTGRSAHSSLGAEDSAIHALVDDLSSLLRDVPDGMSLNVGTIRGGSAPNVQAAAASCQVCARVRGGIEPLRKLFKERLRRARWRLPDQATLGLELFVPESRCESALEVKFGSDCSIFAQRYERIMLFGPGSIADAHTEDERLSRTELAEAAAVLAGVLKEIA